MKGKLFKKILIPILILAAAAGGWYYLQSRAEQGLAVVTIVPEKTDVTATVAISGDMLAADTETIVLPQGILLQSVAVAEGDEIAAGQVLAAGDASDLIRKREKLVISREDLLRQREEALNPPLAANAAGIRSQVAQARSQVALQEKRLADAQVELGKRQQLLAAGAIAQSEVESQQRTISEIDIQLDIARAQLSSALSQQSDLPADTELKAQDIEVQLVQLDKDIAQLDADIAELTWTAPMSGTVTRVTPVSGRETTQDDFVRIDDLSSYRVEALVPQEDAILLREGQSASVSMKGGSAAWPATVLSVARYASVEASSGSSSPRVRVVMALDAMAEDADAPVVGFEADAVVVTGATSDRWTLPREAVVREDEGEDYVWIVENGAAAKRSVTVLLSDAVRVAVEGLDGTESAVAIPVEGLAPGVKVDATDGDGLANASQDKKDGEVAQ